MLLRLQRGATGVGVVLAQTDDLASFHIDVDSDVTPAEATRVLFESGAAVQLAGDGYLISRDWLLRQGVPGGRTWEKRLDAALHSPEGKAAFVEAFDAVRVSVVRPTSA